MTNANYARAREGLSARGGKKEGDLSWGLNSWKRNAELKPSRKSSGQASGQSIDCPRTNAWPCSALYFASTVYFVFCGSRRCRMQQYIHMHGHVSFLRPVHVTFAQFYTKYIYPLFSLVYTHRILCIFRTCEDSFAFRNILVPRRSSHRSLLPWLIVEKLNKLQRIFIVDKSFNVIYNRRASFRLLCLIINSYDYSLSTTT